MTKVNIKQVLKQNTGYIGAVGFMIVAFFLPIRTAAAFNLISLFFFMVASLFGNPNPEDKATQKIAVILNWILGLTWVLLVSVFNYFMHVT